MKNRTLTLAALFMAGTLLLGGCGQSAGSASNAGNTNQESSTEQASGTEQNAGETADNSDAQTEDDLGNIVEFRPVDCGIQAQDVYEYPFMGMTAKLSENILEKMDSREIFVFSQEDYSSANDISYALLRFSATTEEQREEKGMSVDILSWEAGLEKIGAIGVYKKDKAAQLDELTACDTHEKIGESPDGAYEYYISTNSKGNQELAADLKQSDISIGEMHELDAKLGYTAFSTDRVEGVATVGDFSTKDVFGNTYTQDVFQDYDLTLVNVFATWCSPCVEEIPELEKLRQEYAKKNIKLGIVAVVLDTKTTIGMDEGAVERAQTLYERSEAQFPFLIPDDGNMNDRLTGIESVPESFFVDKDGNIVSEPYIGARSQEDWAKIVDEELANLKGEN